MNLTASIRINLFAIAGFVQIAIAPIFIAPIFIALTASATAGDNVVIVLDDSGSMNERMSGGTRRIDAAKKAIAQVLKQFPVDTKLGLMLLNGEKAKQHWAIPLEHLSLAQATRRVEAVKADGGTPLGDRMREGADALLQLREKEIYGNYRLLIVTDGEANDKKQLELYLPDVLSRGLLVDAIGVDMRQDHSLATRVHSYRRADDATALSKAIEEVFAEKVDLGTADSEADFALLNAIDESTAIEALRALAKPDNKSVVGFSLPIRSGQSDSNNNSLGSASIPIVNNIPVNSGANNNAADGNSFLATMFVSIASCMCPLLIIIIAIAAVFAKAKR